MIKVPLRHARAIEAGRATQVLALPGERRLVKRKDAERRGRSAMRWQEPQRPKVNMEDTITGTDGRTTVTVRVVITGVHQQPLGALTGLDARLQGHGAGAASIYQAKAEWVQAHDTAWLNRHKVHLADVLGPAVVPFILCRRFDTRWANTIAWVLEVRPVETRELLADTRLGRGDYTHSACHTIDREAETVDTATLQRYALHAVASQDSFKAALLEARAAKHAARGRAFREATG